MASIVYASRFEHAPAEVLDKISMLRTSYGAKIIEIPLKPIEISSSEIREAFLSEKDMSAYLTAPVLDFIEERGLYR